MTNRYPTLVIDDFFSNPLHMRYAMQNCEYNVTEDIYPGKRTDNLQFIDSDLHKFLKTKILSVFHEQWHLALTSFNMSIAFEILTPYKEKDDIRNAGIVRAEAPSEFNGVIFLDEEPDPDAGISLYTKTGEYAKMPDGMIDEYKKLYSGKEVDMDKFQKDYDKLMSYYTESITIKPKYNRLVMFDGTSFYRCPNFGNQTRHTMVFGCGISPNANTLYHPPAPLHRVI